MTPSSVSLGPGLFRLILAGMVVVSHLSRFQVGIVAVMTFVMLSGYWVTRMYCEKYRAAATAPVVFYLSRFLRLWPAYAAAILISLALRWLIGMEAGVEDLTSLAIIGVAIHDHDPIRVSWSLDHEMQFYLLLPLLVWATRRRFWPTALLLVLAAGIAIGADMLIGFQTVVGFLPVFLAGMAVHLFDVRASRTLALSSLGLFIAVGVAMTLAPSVPGFVTGPTQPLEVSHSVGMLWAFTLFPFVAWNVRQPAKSWDKALGDLSYCVYLAHTTVIAIFRHYYEPHLTPVAKLVALAALAATGLAFYRRLDRPLEAWRSAFVRRILSARVRPAPNIP